MNPHLARIIDRLPIKRIDRYLMRQFLISYGVCTTAVLGLFVVIEGVSRLQYFLRQDEFIGLVLFRYFVALVPVFFTQYLGPVLTLMAGMFAITILNKGSEIVPLKAAGLSIQRVLGSFFLVAGFMGVTMMAVQEWVLPNLREQIQLAMSYGKRKQGISDINVPDSLGQLISVGKYYPKGDRGTNVEVRRLSGEVSSVTELIRAREIKWNREDGYWELLNGQVLRWDEEGKYIHPEGEDVTFARITLETDMRPEDLEATDRDIPYLSHRELSHQIKRHEHAKHIEVKLHRRYAFPMANLILLLLGMPLVLRGENKSVAIGVGGAMLVSALYLFSDAVCADLGNKGALPPILAAWLPVLFFGALGLTLFDGMES